MKDARRGVPLAATDILTVLVASAAVFFVLAFGAKLVEAYRLERQNAVLEAEKASLESRKQTLINNLEFVGSAAYVEKIAREQWKWARPGDKLVITTYRYVPASSVGGPFGVGVGEQSETQPSWLSWLRRLRSLFDSL